MKILTGKILGIFVLGLFLSVDRAWAIRDADMGQTVEEKKKEEKVNALAELMAKIDGNNIASCSALRSLFGSRGRLSKEQGRTFNAISDSMVMRTFSFGWFFGPEGGRLAYVPFVVKKPESLKDLEDQGAAVTRMEIMDAMGRACPILKEKALEDIKNKISTSLE